MSKINVTKSYLPPFEEYIAKIKSIWDNHFLTNYGYLHNELEEKMTKYLGVERLHYVNNGTIALLLALDCLNLENCEIITTPFSFIATASSIVWQKCKPVFVDISQSDFNIDVSKIEEKITNKTKAILAVHCFGFPCEVEKISNIAKKHKLHIIYDAAHAFGVKYKNKSLLSYGDISCCSLHATKIFHTVEGGLCIVNNENYNSKMTAIKNFGKLDQDYEFIGINAKNSEFHAAMGLCVLDHLDEIITKRKHVYDRYKSKLNKIVTIPNIPNNCSYNYIYFPVLFKNENELLKVFNALNEKEIYPRRYFYPALTELKIFETNDEFPVSLDISKRIACLPFDTYLNDTQIGVICDVIQKCCKGDV